MTAKDTARDLVVLKALGDRVKAANETSKHGALSSMDAGDRTTAKLPDGTAIGAVTVARGRVAPKVVDERALFDWVRKNAQTEIETVDRVRPAYIAKLLEEAKKNGVIVPGIDLVEGDPYVVVKPTTDASAAIARAWADGSLPLPRAVLGEIEAGQ